VGQSKHDLVARALISERTQAAMADPEVRKRISIRTTLAMADPKVKQRQIAGLKAAFACPSLRKKISEATKAGMALWRERNERKLIALRDAWNAAPKAIRTKFLSEITGKRVGDG
jgi:hypothetical protein